MGFGFELRDSSGNLSMDTESFGLLLADTFMVAYNTAGSKFYPDLDWSNIVVPTQTMDINGSVYSRTLSSFAFLNFSVTRNSSNEPTVHWAVGSSNSAGLGGNTNDTSNAVTSQGSSGVNDCFSKVLSFGGEKRPDISVAIFAG